ncbi:MAG TPA: hypothetical protein PKB13_12005 [Clostridia bacterium]|nr:hypothetical protein [Clostridia bacterium]
MKNCIFYTDADGRIYVTPASSKKWGLPIVINNPVVKARGKSCTGKTIVAHVRDKDTNRYYYPAPNCPIIQDC